MRRQDGAAAILFGALAVAMTWPLAPNLGRAVSDPGDPYLNIWILDWDWWATFRAPLSLFHANAFHPARYALAFSENLYAVAVLLFPLRFFGVDAISAYNIAMLLGIALSGFGAYLLGYRLSGSWSGGMAAGVFYAFVPWRFLQFSHIQHMWGGWLPLMLLALLRYAERPTRKRGMVFATLFVANALSNIHYLFFGALASALTAVLLLPRAQWRELAVATLAALAILAPFLYPYAAVAELYGMQRTYEEVLGFSARATDWLSGQTNAELQLYPGWLGYAVALAGLVIVRKRAPQIALALLWIAIGFLGSLGLHFVFHEFLFGAVPGFRAIRVPARWAVIAYIGMAILIALATSVLAKKNRWLALLVPIAFVAHLWQAPWRWFLADPHPAPVYRWLAQQPPTAIAELPIDSLSGDYEYLLRATIHHQKLINGVSGFTPPQRLELSRLSNETPISPAFVEALRAAGVEYVIVHADALGGRREVVWEWVRREKLQLVRVFDSKMDGDYLFRLSGAAGFSPPKEPGRLKPPAPQAPPCNETLGALDFPPAAIHFDRGRAIFSGWTISRHGIRSVDVWFDNRTVRHRAKLTPDPSLNARCAGKRVTRTRYLLTFDDRPGNVNRETDVQVEVTDGRGAKSVFDNRWITWEQVR
jgi:hypothetical protein